MNETSVTAAFKDWWIESYRRPPSDLGTQTHVAFAMHILKLMELTQEVSDD